MKKFFTSLMLLAAFSVPVYLSANAALAAADGEVNEGSEEAFTIESDLTGRFELEPAKWTGASGWCAAQFGPYVTTNDGRRTLLVENFQGNASATGDLIYQTLSGLLNGTYRIEIYAAAASTHERDGFATDVKEGDTDAAEAFALTSAGRVAQPLTAFVATSFTEVNTVVLENVQVTDGTCKIGLTKLSPKTNWHIIQIKGVTAIVDGNALLDAAMADYEKYKDLPMEIALKEAMETAKAAVEANKTAETLNAFNTAISAAKASAAAYATVSEKLAAMKELVDATNFYTQEAYDTYYGTPAAAFEAGTLSTADAAALQNPSLVTGWHDDITADNFLLSVWDVEPDFAGPYYINTWSVEGDNDGTGFRVPFFEYWTGDADSLGEKVLTAKLEGLQPGKYNVSAWVRVRAKNNVAAADATGITASVNGGEAVDVTEGEAVGQFNLAEYTACGVVGEDGVLTFTFSVAADNNISWLSFKNVKYSPIYEPSNLDFSEGAPVSAGVRTYAKDIKAEGETSGMQPVEGWTIAVENGDARAAGVFAYGSGLFLGGEDFVAPVANPDGNFEGNALGLLGVWTGTIQYTQPVTLEAGSYVLTIPVYNAGGNSVPVKSLIGFIAEDGTEHLAPAKAYTVGEWTVENIAFTLDKTTNGVFSLGYQGQNVGSGSAQHLFVDGITAVLVTEADLARTELDAELTDALALMINIDVIANDETLFGYSTAAGDAFEAVCDASLDMSQNGAATAEELRAQKARLVEAKEALLSSPVNQPDPNATYVFSQKGSELYLSVFQEVNAEGEETNGVRLSDLEQGFGWVSVEGGYQLTNGAGLFIGLAGTNNWTMSALEEKAMTINATIALIDNGVVYYTLNEEKGSIGTDNVEAGSACYANKSEDAVGDRALWAIKKLSDIPVGVQRLEGQQRDAAIFDLSGRRVNKAQKGIYIVGGKKVVK